MKRNSAIVFTKEQESIIIALYNKLVPLKEIADYFHCSSYYIKKKVKELHLPKRQVQEVVKQSNLKKHGYEYPFQSEEIQNQVKLNVFKKYGVNNISELPEVKKKKEQTFLDKYGVSSYSKTDEWLERHNNTCLEKFGFTNNSKSPLWKEQVIQTNTRKFEQDWNTKTESFREKSKESSLTRYGVENYTQRNITNYSDYLDFESWVHDYLKNHEKITPKVVCEYFNLTLTGALQKIYSSGLAELFYIQKPKFEVNIKNFLDNLDIKYEIHNRTKIHPYELDFFFPELGLAIEINDIRSHLYKSKEYHLKKTLLCEEQKIVLIHIWEWEINNEFYEWLEYILKNWESVQIPTEKEVLVDMCKPIQLNFLNKYYKITEEIAPQVIYQTEKHKIFDCGKRIYRLEE